MRFSAVFLHGRVSAVCVDDLLSLQRDRARFLSRSQRRGREFDPRAVHQDFFSKFDSFRSGPEGAFSVCGQIVDKKDPDSSALTFSISVGWVYRSSIRVEECPLIAITV